MRNLIRRVPVLLLLLLLCGACTPSVTLQPLSEVHYVKPPAQMLTCKTVGAAPEVGDDRVVAGYLVDLYEGYTDCKDKLGAVAEYINGSP